MDLPSSKVIEVLEGKGVTQIHHANSVLTATQFLRRAALLSRGTIERRGLFQTEQLSDKLDKKYGLWFDVFTDSVDIHERASKVNEYGPVLFVLDLDQLKKMYKGRLWVTKLNPTKWNGVSDKDRWFRSIVELEDDFSVGTFDQMIVFRHSGGELPIRSCLTEIILDDPGLKMPGNKHIDIFSMAYGALQVSMTEGGIDVPVKKRNCHANCKCLQRYASRDFVAKMFFPF